MKSFPKPHVLAAVFAAGAIALSCVAAPSAAAAVTPAPAWLVAVSSYPTVFQKGSEAHPFGGNGPGYAIRATNVGAAPTAGTFTIETTLPAGVTPSVNPPPEGILGAKQSSLKCSTSGQLVTCTGSQEVPPGETINMLVPVDVSSAAPSQLTESASASGGGAVSPQSGTSITEIGSSLPKFSFLNGNDGLYTNVTDPDGSTPTLAASHPYQAMIGLGFPTKQDGEEALANAGEPKDISVTLPRGIIINPNATAKRCTEQELESDLGGHPQGCPLASQVGLATPVIKAGPVNAKPVPLFNMVPPPGAPAEFGLDAEAGVYIHLFGHVHSNGQYELSAGSFETPAKLPILGVSVSLWGSPTDPSHDAMRGIRCVVEPTLKCPTEPGNVALVTLPSDCPGSAPVTSATADSWADPGLFVQRAVAAVDSAGNPSPITDCGSVKFEPSFSARPSTSRADSPVGLDFQLHQPQDLSVEGRGTSQLKDATVSLPVGMSLNPSAANGLAACTEAQIGVEPAAGRLSFSETPQGCPNAAKIGTLEVNTPLLEHHLSGQIYVAKPFANPFGSLLAIYLAIEDEDSGIIAKLAGSVTPDPKTGQLTATFTENPELPIEDIDLHFFPGSRAPLKSPLTCGSYTTSSSLVPWSTPDVATVHPNDAFTTNVAASGSGPCPASEATAPFDPTFDAGTHDPTAGKYSPFVLKLGRADGEQHLTAIDSTLPNGLLGKLAGIPYCPESAIAAARSREAPQRGVEEQASPSCPAASEVGTVTVGAGAGPEPYYVTGRAYLAGPYGGAPLSLVIVAPAVAGPFDLGNVVTRVALKVEEYSARIHAVSAPLPTIIDGIPLDLRSLAVNVNRPNFIINPTSCREKQIVGSVASEDGATVGLLNRFQVRDCGKLDFKPKLKLSLTGSTKRSGHPALKAVVTYPKRGAYANIGRAQVGLPHSEFLDQGNLDKVCTQPQLKARSCPKRSIYGYAKAWSPLLAKPLEGPVYLGVGFGDKLPDLVAELNGQIRVLLKGKVDTDKMEGIRNTFEAVPDAPVSRFVLRLKGGKRYGLLENSENICKKRQRARTRFTSQSGIVNVGQPLIANSCGHGQGSKNK